MFWLQQSRSSCDLCGQDGSERAGRTSNTTSGHKWDTARERSAHRCRRSLQVWAQTTNEVESLSVFPGRRLLFETTNPAWTFVSYLFCDWLWMDAGDRGHRRHHKRKDCHRKGKRLTKGPHTDYRQRLHRELKDLNVRLSDTMWDYTCTGRLWAWVLTW